MLSPRTSSDCQHSPRLPPALGFRVSEMKEAQTFPWKSGPIISAGPRGRHSSRERPFEGLKEGAPFSSWQKSAAPAGGDAGGPEPAGGAGGSASPAGGAPARLGPWRAPYPHPAHTAHAVRLLALVLFSAQLRGTEALAIRLSLICLLQGPHSALRTPLWLQLMSCHSSNQESHRTRHLLPIPLAPLTLAPVAPGTFLSISMGPAHGLSLLIPTQPGDRMVIAILQWGTPGGVLCASRFSCSSTLLSSAPPWLVCNGDGKRKGRSLPGTHVLWCASASGQS